MDKRLSLLAKAGPLLLLLYVIAGLIYSSTLAHVARFPDEDNYLKLSYNLLHGPGFSFDGVHLTARRPPGYAYFLAALRAFGGNYFCFRVAHFILLAGTAFLVYRLFPGKKHPAGLLVVTTLTICYPILFYTAGTLYPQTLSAFLFVLALNFLLAAPQSYISNFAAGITFGLLILVVPTFAFTMPVVLLVAGMLRIVRWHNVLVVALSAVLMSATWTVRNAMVFDRFVPIASNSGVNLFIGNNKGATPTSAEANEKELFPYYLQVAALNLDEFQRDVYFRKLAVDWISANPGKATVLYFEKSLNFFNIINVYIPGTEAEISPWKQVVMAVSYLFLLGLLFWRLCDTGRFPMTAREKLFLAVYVLSAFTSAIFFTRIRLRLPYDFLVIWIVAVYLSSRLEQWMKSGDRKNSIHDGFPPQT